MTVGRLGGAADSPGWSRFPGGEIKTDRLDPYQKFYLRSVDM